jgi:hypothetical protein
VHVDRQVRLACILLAMIAAFAVGSAAALAQRSHGHRGPSAARIHRAIARAQHSNALWATVNVCHVKGRAGAKGGSIGVRGQMPTLGFAATLSMKIQLNQWSSKNKAFGALSYATARTTVSPGTFARNLHQDGAVFPFGGPAGLLNATVTFSWSRGGRLLGTASRQTAAGHHDAAGARPAHYSAAQCRLG